MQFGNTPAQHRPNEFSEQKPGEPPVGPPSHPDSRPPHGHHPGGSHAAAEPQRVEHDAGRGDGRNTGTSLLFGFIGLAVLAAGGYVAYREVRVHTRFIEHKCVVLEKHLRVNNSTDGAPTYRPDFLIEYTVDGQVYREWAYDITGGYSSGRGSKERVLASFTVGQQYPCWYDPAKPDSVVLVRNYSWFLYLFLFGIGLLFSVLGFGSL